MATFGKLDDGAGASASSLDKMYVSSASPSTNGTVTSGSARTWLSATGSTNVKFVIYADSAGEPGALLAQSDVLVVSNTSEQQNNFTFSGGNQISVTSGTPYWIGVAWQDPGTPSLNVSRDSTATSRREQNYTYPTLPDPFGTPSASNSGPIDAFVTYTEGGGPAPYLPKVMVF